MVTFGASARYLIKSHGSGQLHPSSVGGLVISLLYLATHNNSDKSHSLPARKKHISSYYYITSGK